MITTVIVRVHAGGFAVQQLQKLFLTTMAFKLVQRTNSLNKLFKTAVYVLMFFSIGFRIPLTLSLTPPAAVFTAPRVPPLRPLRPTYRTKHACQRASCPTPAQACNTDGRHARSTRVRSAPSLILGHSHPSRSSLLTRKPIHSLFVGTSRAVPVDKTPIDVGQQ